jgi:hypothetical protein
MLFPTLVLLAFPAIRRFAPGIWRSLTGTETIVSRALLWAGDYVSGPTMGLAKIWTSAWAEAPSVFLGMSLFALFCFFWSAKLVQRNVQHFAEAALRTLRGRGATKLAPPKLFENFADKLAYGRGVAGFLRDAGETLFFILVVLFAVGLAIVIALVIKAGLILAWENAYKVFDALVGVATWPVAVLLVLGLFFAGIGSASRGA